jgi:predicted methyltransferase
MMTRHSLLCVALLCIGAATQVNAASDAINAAVGDASRTERDTQRDINRKPADVLTFAGVKPGDKVGELLPGGGYFTKLLCKVVGDKGHVYTMSVIPVIKLDRPPPDVPPSPPGSTPCTNITADSKLAAEMSLPAGLDLVWTSENYHDLHNPMFGPADMTTFNKAIFAALKPGGVFIVEDHAAESGSGARDTGTLHRIDAELVKQEVVSAGFKFESASDVLHNADDPHTAKVFELKGRSDKFLLKFRKPLK